MGYNGFGNLSCVASVLSSCPERLGRKRVIGSNSKVMDSSSKIIFGEPELCSQFLSGYLDIPILRGVKAEDIEDVSERYVHLFVEERNSDVVKRIHLKNEEMPFYLVSLIEHKSFVDHNVVMQVLRYMVYIWEDYEKEQERLHPGRSKQKKFRYPPVLPIVYYDGPEEWTAAEELKDRIDFYELIPECIPNFRCILVRLHQFSNEELMQHKDELSVVMMISKLQKHTDLKNLSTEEVRRYLREVTEQSPEHLLDIISQVVRVLLSRINVSNEEAENFADQVKERRMGELFTYFEKYDVQEMRRIVAGEREQMLEEMAEKMRQIEAERAEMMRQTAEMMRQAEAERAEMIRQIEAEKMQHLQEERYASYIELLKEFVPSRENAVLKLIEKFQVTLEEAEEKMAVYW